MKNIPFQRQKEFVRGMLLVLCALPLFTLAAQVSEKKSNSNLRQRISINEGWCFYKYDSADEADHLIYDVHPEVKKFKG